mmetsp:Transcript_4502/g.6737  ORF Transcript_4502/g.6737 Transcript_4502/m.6737 type:complete len:228 (-) Transcript_4502:217-900(-)|eukprot:CAMPEP_0167762874 /NCGR_PEP_ID=MMETSP0110_2-20121227/13028_1 /TAXON_ID=629695 /ORGANISM="Gymnochlora sp., Strain CCMP2014" /LENGTH=227 /DNA_ID=CAMNT_0007649833 /DNA_START=74 /DNA_END=757 /DNA_ORIENTATION=-
MSDDTSALAMMKKATELKNAGNIFYREKKYQKALAKYTKIFLYVNHLTLPDNLKQMVGTRAPDTSNVEQKDVKKIQVVANQNCALCFFQLKRYDKCEEFCNRALAIDSKAPKATMMRGRARVRLGNLDGAQADLEFALEKFAVNTSSHKNVKADIALLKQKWKAVRAKQRKQFAGIFDRMSKSSKKKAEEQKGKTEAPSKSEPAKSAEPAGGNTDISKLVGEMLGKK